MKILIVDDTITWGILVKFWLHDLNIDYDYAENGFEAIKYLQQNNYDIMITDISMPEMSGFKLVDYVKQHFSVLIAVMSNHDDYIKLMVDVEYKFPKPTSFEKFKQMIYIIISGKCNLINNGECNLTLSGDCNVITEKDCIISKHEIK